MPDSYLRVSLTTARLDFEAENARLDIRQPPPRLTVLRHRGEADVQARHPELEVDGSGARAMEGRRTIAELTADAGRQALADAGAAARQYNAEGQAAVDGLAAGRLARANAARPYFEYSGCGIGYTPFELPQIRFTDNVFHYSREPDRLEYRWEIHPTAEIQPVQQTGFHAWLARAGRVDIELARLDTRA